MFHLAGVDKRAFLDGVNADPQTYKDWSSGEWEIETSGKEDDMFSPYLGKPFEQAITDGAHPCRVSPRSPVPGARSTTLAS